MNKLIDVLSLDNHSKILSAIFEYEGYLVSDLDRMKYRPLLVLWRALEAHCRNGILGLYDEGIFPNTLEQVVDVLISIGENYLAGELSKLGQQASVLNLDYDSMDALSVKESVSSEIERIMNQAIAEDRWSEFNAINNEFNSGRRMCVAGIGKEFANNLYYESFQEIIKIESPIYEISRDRNILSDKDIAITLGRCVELLRNIYGKIS